MRIKLLLFLLILSLALSIGSAQAQNEGNDMLQYRDISIDKNITGSMVCNITGIPTGKVDYIVTRAPIFKVTGSTAGSMDYDASEGADNTTGNVLGIMIFNMTGDMSNMTGNITGVVISNNTNMDNTTWNIAGTIMCNLTDKIDSATGNVDYMTENIPGIMVFNMAGDMDNMTGGLAGFIICNKTRNFTGTIICNITGSANEDLNETTGDSSVIFDDYVYFNNLASNAFSIHMLPGDSLEVNVSSELPYNVIVTDNLNSYTNYIIYGRWGDNSSPLNVWSYCENFSAFNVQNHYTSFQASDECDIYVIIDDASGSYNNVPYLRIILNQQVVHC